MSDKKGKVYRDEKKGKPAVTNDQLGENAGEARVMKGNTKGGKCQ